MLKCLEVGVDMNSPGATVVAIEKAAAKLPKNAKFLGSSATAAFVYLFYDIPGYAPAEQPPPPPPPPPPPEGG